MKILILTAKCGMGHFNCAKAIKEKIDTKFKTCDVEVVDIYEEKFKDKADIFYKLYNFLVNFGNPIYNIAYKNAVKKTEKEYIFNLVYDLMVDRFSEIMEEKKPDLVISTYSLTSEIMSIYKKKSGSKTPLITWITDINAHNAWVNNQTDFYIAPDMTTKSQLMEMGVEEEKIQIGGIPIINKVPNRTKKVKDKKKILLMGGGLGLLPKSHGFYKALNDIDGVEITVITGKNKTLYKKINNKYENIKVLGYVNNVGDHLLESDLLVTKPGGVTSFEAINSQVPMVVFKPSLDQEVDNAKFIKKKNIGLVLESRYSNPYKTASVIKNLIEDENALNIYSKNLKEIKDQIKDNILEEMLEEKIC